VTFEDDTAGIGPQESVQRIEKGGLAGPVGTNHAEDLPGGDAQRDILQCAEATERLRKAAHLEHGLDGPPRRAHRLGPRQW